jgi:hypothetical protein
MPPFTTLAASNKRAHERLTASAAINYDRVIEALRIDVQSISTVITQEQRVVFQQDKPIDVREQAVWADSTEGKASVRQELDRQRKAYESEWGTPSGGW